MCDIRKKYDIEFGIQEGFFDDLKPSQKKVVLKLLARASERAFRRGYQQGQESGKEAAITGFDLRYGKKALPLDKSLEPIMGKRIIPSLERFMIENNGVKNIGLS